MRYPTNEKQTALFCVFISILVAATVAPSGSYFFDNFIYFWPPQAGVFLIPAIIYSRPAVISGAALILSLYLAAFNSWNVSNDPESLTWLGYLFSLPGAAIGAGAGALYLKGKTNTKPIYVGAAIAVSTFIGLAINQTFVCSTVMHCGFQ